MLHRWDVLQGQLRSGAVSRRQFIAGAAALGITGSLVNNALAQTPKRGGNLVVGVSQGSSADSLDPAKWNTEFQYVAGHMVYDSLIYVNEKFELVPVLAESWEAKGGGVKEWVIKLRKGVTFHNGKTLTPADVVYSLDHHRNTTSMGRAIASSFEDIKATGPNEVTITLKAPNADLPYFLSEYHMMIGPEGTSFDGVGTGPFVIDSFQPGVRSRAKRNANDWNKDRGYVDTAEVLFLPDPTARVSAVLSGSVNLVTKVSANSVGPIQNNPGIQVFSIAGGTHLTLVMACDKAPYANNLDLRLALKYAIDREAVLKTAFRGFGKIGNDHPVPEGMNMYSPDIPQRKYDADKAKFHLKKSGYDGPIVLAASDGAFQGGVPVAEIFQSSAKAAGLDFQIKAVPATGYFTTIFDNTFFESTFGGRPTADLVLSAEFGAGSPINESRWNDPKFNQLLVAARGETDNAKRKQMYHDLQLMAHEEAGTIIPLFATNIDVGTKNVRGYIPSPVATLTGWRAPERIWLADS